ncbi:MAG: DciA family protein [Phycisphaerales bacterium]
MSRQDTGQDRALAASLDRLRGHRNRPDRASDLAGEMASAAKQVKSRARAVGGIAAAWEVCVPDDLRGACELVSCTNGVVTVRALDATARYRLDRWLRGGGERTLRETAQAAVKRVRVVTR